MGADKSSPSVVVVGDALIDELETGGAVRRYVGGAALNVAVRLASLGIDTQLIAMVGDDPDGDAIRAFLAARRVHLIATKSQHGTAHGYSHRVNGEPVYSFDAAARTRRVRIGPSEQEALAHADFVVLSCFPLDDTDQTDEVLRAIPDGRRRLIIDPNPRLGLLTDREAFVRGLARVAADSRLVKVGQEDAGILSGTSVDDFASRLVQEGAATVLATLGEGGAFVLDQTGVLAQSPIVALSEPIVDTMGAGDATLASIVHSVVRDGFPRMRSDWSVALDDAMQFAAETCRHEGALAAPPI